MKLIFSNFKKLSRKTLLNRVVLLLLFSNVLSSCNNNTTEETENTLTAVVSDPTGLSIFDETSYNSRKIIKIAYQEKIILLEDTKKSDVVAGVQGTWFKVKYKNMEGFAFSGFFEVKEIENNASSSPKDIFKGTIYSGGIRCDGLTYSEYGNLIVFKDNNQVQFFQFDIGYGKLSKGVYELKEDKIILKLKYVSELIEENMMYGVTEKPSNPKVSQKTIDEVQVYLKSNCDDRFALRRENGDDKMAYVDFEGAAETRSYIPNSYEMIERHINIVNTVSSNKSAPSTKEIPSNNQSEYSNISGVYVSYEEGIEERIYLELDSRKQFNVFYKSPKYKNRVRLNVRNSNLQTQSCEVSFPNEPKTYYKMQFNINGATCTYPSGKVQHFEMQ